MKINIAVAFSKNYGIGFKNNLPWSHLKEDMRLFSKRTIGSGNNAVIMGKNTWFSIPECRRPLKNRTNIVISSSSSSSSLSLDGTGTGNNPFVFSSINDAILFCECQPSKYDELWVIGGSRIYDEFLNTYYNKLNRIYITFVCGDYECDTFIHFPAADYCVEKEEQHNGEERCHYLICIHNSHKDNDANYNYKTLEMNLKNYNNL